VIRAGTLQTRLHSSFSLDKLSQLTQADPTSLCATALALRARFVKDMRLFCVALGFTDLYICFAVTVLAGSEDLDLGHRYVSLNKKAHLA